MPMHPWRVSVPPAGEPVTTDDVKAHLRRTDLSDEDALIAIYAKAARERVEQYLNRALVEQTQEMTIDWNWPDGVIKIPNPPLIGVDSITYIDGAGVTQTLDPSLYIVDTIAEPGRIDRAYSAIWPTVRYQIGAITVTYRAGFVADGGPPVDYGANIPTNWRLATILLAGHYFENRRIVAIGTIASDIQETLDALLTDRVVPIG